MPTPVTAANFSITGWGGGGALSAVSGTQTRSTITITAGGGSIISPIVTFTYPDGPYPIPPLSMAWMIGGTGIIADIAVDRNDLFPLSTTFIYKGLPVLGKTYILVFDVRGV